MTPNYLNISTSSDNSPYKATEDSYLPSSSDLCSYFIEKLVTNYPKPSKGRVECIVKEKEPPMRKL